MKTARMLGNIIEKISTEKGISSEELSTLLNCSKEKIEGLFKGRVLISYEQLTSLANKLGTTVEYIINGDEEHYNKTVVRCVNEFTDTAHREKILDIIYDYVDICEATSQ